MLAIVISEGGKCVGLEKAAAVTSAAMVGGCREVTRTLLLLVVNVAVVLAIVIVDSAVI